MTKFRDDNICVGDRVVGGEGDDRDYGRVHEISSDGSLARVGWKSGVETRSPVEDLSRAN